MRSAVFDIETTALEGIGAGIMLCACVRPLATNRTRTFRIDAYHYEYDPLFGFLERQERDLVKDVLDELNKYQLLIGHNIENFDMGYLRTRAYRHDLAFPMDPFTFDTVKSFRRVKLRTVLNAVGKPSANLDMVADFLGLKQEKTKIYPVQHWESVWANERGRTEAMNGIVDHCQKDVRMNAEMYDILLPLDKKANIRRWY